MNITDLGEQFITDTGDRHPSWQAAVRMFSLSLAAMQNGIVSEEDLNRIIVPTPHKQSPVPYRVICDGLMYGMSGFAEATRNMVYALDKYEVNVMASPADKKNADNVDVTETEKGKRIDYLSRVTFMRQKKTVRITMNIPMGIRRHIGDDYQIAYIMFETQEFPKKYIDHLKQQCDEIWTPSTFNVENIKAAGWDKPIFRMPLGVDTDQFNPDKTHYPKFWEMPIATLMSQYYIFLSIMGWSERKGVSILLDTYFRTFHRQQDVLLYIKGGWYDQQKAWETVRESLAKSKNSDPPPVFLDFNIYPTTLMPKLYKAADCFVLPTLGEGWGLNVTEAMAMGLPVIASYNTSMTDYMTGENSYPIPVRRHDRQPACDWICSEYKGAFFSFPDPKSLADSMNYLYATRIVTDPNGREARKTMKDKYTWTCAAMRWIDRLQHIQL